MAAEDVLASTGATLAAPPSRHPVVAEFQVGWPVLLAAMIGIGVGIIAIPSPAIGVFMRNMQTEFGWSRAEISLGPTILVATLALVAPWLGWLADRVPSRAIVAVSLTALAISLFLFSRLGGALWVYYLGFAIMAAAGSGAATLVYARVLSGAFHQARGLALGLAMIGNGITGVVLPLLLVPYAATHGWRDGFVALALIVAVATPLVVLLIGAGRGGKAAKTGNDAPGATFGEALGGRAFWVMAAAFMLIPLAAGGLHLHFLAYLADVGVDAATAGFLASLGGVALVTARLLTGFLIDHIFAPYVAAVMMMLSALSIGAMAIFGAPAAALGAIAVGLSIGAELDLIGYMTARYYGMKAYGRIYGILYAVVLVGSAVSPVIYGLAVDLTHSYQAMLTAAAAILAACAVLFLTLPRFPRSVQG
ncbi:L-lactate transporter [Alphaproteobacteria bacterium SO-S41]|nr:L-lactate transporter [Alphaproteobacteria bacterium SO-S41]